LGIERGGIQWRLMRLRCPNFGSSDPVVAKTS
jgi:hypothetical protein